MGVSAGKFRGLVIAMLGVSCLAVSTDALASGYLSSPAHMEINSKVILVQSSLNEKSFKEAEKFVEQMGHKAISFLEDTSITDEKRKSGFKKLLEESFDMNTISRFSSGKNWRTASPEQRKEYMALFKEMVVNVYSERFSEYKGQIFKITGSRPEGDKDIIVNTRIVSPNDPEIKVDWRVRYKNGKYRIIDVIVEGVSMSITQRSEFASVIARGGGNFQVLIDHMKDQVNGDSSR